MGRSRRHKKPQEGIFEAEIIALSHDGRGIAKVNGKTTFIPFTLPREVVKFEYTFTKAKFDEAKVVEYIKNHLIELILLVNILKFVEVVAYNICLQMHRLSISNKPY